MKTCRLVLPSVLIVLVLQLGLSWAQTPKYGGTLRIALSGEPAFFNANQGPAPGAPAFFISNSLYNSLLTLTPPPELTYTTWRFRTTFASLHTQDATDFPLPYPLVPTISAGAATNVSGVLRSGTGVFHRALQAPGAPGFALSFVRSGTTPLPAAIVPRLSVIRVR